MDDRFANLVKIPAQPAARLLAAENAELDTPVTAPASAPVEVVMRELAQKEAWVDMVRLLSVALPVRERIWWACLAARDMLEPGARVPPPLAAAEAWGDPDRDPDLEELDSGDVRAPRPGIVKKVKRADA